MCKYQFQRCFNLFSKLIQWKRSEPWPFFHTNERLGQLKSSLGMNHGIPQLHTVPNLPIFAWFSLQSDIRYWFHYNDHIVFALKGPNKVVLFFIFACNFISIYWGWVWWGGGVKANLMKVINQTCRIDNCVKTQVQRAQIGNCQGAPNGKERGPSLVIWVL